MGQKIHIRPYVNEDRVFVLSLAPILGEVAGLDWHTDEAMQIFQESYIAEKIDQNKDSGKTLIAEIEGQPAGFIHVCGYVDEISGEACGTVPLLAVSETCQGKGVGKALMNAAENWALDQGYRLLHLEVFAANKSGHDFYKNNGFKDDTMVMVKPLK